MHANLITVAASVAMSIAVIIKDNCESLFQLSEDFRISLESKLRARGQLPDRFIWRIIVEDSRRFKTLKRRDRVRIFIQISE
jgi:hypothetical protein